MIKIEFNEKKKKIFIDGKVLPFKNVECFYLGDGQYYCACQYDGDYKKKLIRYFNETTCLGRIKMDLSEFDVYKDYIIIEPESVNTDIYDNPRIYGTIDLSEDIENVLRYCSIRFPLTEQGQYAMTKFVYWHKRQTAQNRLDKINEDFS